MSKFKIAAQKALVSVTMVTTMLSLGGFAALPVTALAVAPADYGLHEGDTISASGSSDPDIYIVNELGYKRLFLNPAIFNFYGHLGGFAAVKAVSPATRDAFPTSGLFRNCETNDQKVYGVQVTAEDSGVLHWVNTTGAQAAIDDPNFFKKVFCINNNEFAWYPKGADYTSVNQVPDYNRGGSTTPTPTPGQGGLNGSAGSLDNADFIGSLNNEEVGEGENNIAVSGLDLQADNGSDLRILSVRVSLEEQQAGGSTDLDDYADEVSLWFNGTKVGSVDVDDLTTDDDDSDGEDEWSSSIALTGDAVIRMGQTEDLKVAVSAIDNIDTGDLNANNSWEVAIESVRYVDAQGAITTDTTTEDIGTEANGDFRTFNFVDFSTAADLELDLNEASDNPESRVVDVDDNSSTDDVVLVTGNLEATGGDITVNELTVNIATSGATFSTIADSISLEVDGDVVQTLQSTECSGGAGLTQNCVFDEVDADINEDDSVKFRVLVDINGTDDIGVQGATLLATVDNSDTDADDENGDALTGSELQGNANGEVQAFYDEGIQVSFVSASTSVLSADNEDDMGTFRIVFEVTAFDTDVYLDGSCEDDNGVYANGEGVVYDNIGTTASTSCNLVDDGDIVGATNNWEVLEGETKEFTLSIVASGANSFVTMLLQSINWGDEDLANQASQSYTFNLDEFRTDPLYLGSH